MVSSCRRVMRRPLIPNRCRTPHLPTGVSIMKIGARPEFKVQNPLSAFERRLIDTDRAMRERDE